MGPGNRYILCNGSYNSFISNEMTGGGGEGFTIFGSFNIAYGNSFTDGSGSIKVYSEGNTIAKNNLTNSGGLLFGGGSSNNVIYANRIKGAGLNLMGFNNTFYANEILDVEIGGLHGSLDAANNVFYHNNFLGAAPELRISTREPGPLFLDEGEEGNYCNSYQGSHANNDGIGDAPYTVNAAYYDPDLSMEVTVVCGRDNYPLMTPFDIDSVVMQLPEWASLAFASEQPVLILVPQNITYSTAAVPLNFTVPESAKWVRYSLDGQYNVTVTGNTTLNGLANGFHNLTLYADDPFGNTLVSETIHFSVALPEPFPTAIVTTASIGSVTVVGLGLLFYFKKRRH